jgi:menaquinone-specific isochorismate synthase
MLAPLALLEQLQARLDEAVGAIRTGGPGRLVSLALELPQAPALPPEIAAPRFALIHRGREELKAGYGVAAGRESAGAGRLAELRAGAQGLARDWERHDPDETGQDPFALLGFAADPEPDPRSRPDTGLPNALLWVPELALSVRRGQASLIFAARLPQTRGALRARWGEWLRRLVPALAGEPPEPLPAARLCPRECLPGSLDWQVLVERTLDEIRRGALQKAVLCRRVEYRGQRPFDLTRLLAALAWLFPSCQILRLSRGPTSLVAATPERLVRVGRGWAETDAIAGTAERSPSAARDAALAESLRRCEKSRHEHALVVEAIRRALTGCCSAVEVPPAPAVLKLHNAQHLWTPIRARPGPGTDLFELAERLHPTPATNGTPSREAHAWLRGAEPLARGWYTGAAGVLGLGADSALEGELWVLLRCAELAGDRARLYAGAGIVAGSKAQAEWRETAHKLAAVATALRFA